MTQFLYIVACLHVLICPFTKVEESFNIQAFHDILYHQLNLSQYDHYEFPGVVPRTFIGPLIISLLSAPAVGVLNLIGANKFWMQYVVRFTLALTISGSWTLLRNALQKQFGNTFAWWFTLITVTQYHFMFYMSRPLPNIMVLPLVLLAFEGWLTGKYKQFIISAGASIIIFRSELAMLFGLFLLIDLQAKKINIPFLLKLVVPAGICLVALTVIVDSIFWGRLLWPEAEVFWYNTFLNKSSDWGTSPFLWYFYSALPRGLGPSIILLPVGLYLDRRFVSIAAPALTYILLYSFLPHKELRFIIYVFPLLNMISAAACSYIYIRRTKAPIFELLFWGIIVIIVGNIVLSLALISVAMKNYPGGVAINRFHKHVKGEPFVHLHICNLAAQTGVTRFTQTNDNWVYSKNESLELDQLQHFTHLLVEAKSKYSSNLKYFSQTHVILDSVETFSQVSINPKLLPPIKVKTRPAIFILERNDFREYPKGHNMHFIDSNFVSEDSDSNQISDEETYETPTNYVNIIDSDTEIEEAILPDQDVIEINEIEANHEKISSSSNDQVDEVGKSNKQKESEDINAADIESSDKIIDDLKSLRKARKKKAIAKIKSETRKEVVASAKEKLRELMKRHKHIADGLSSINKVPVDIEESDSRRNVSDASDDSTVDIQDTNIDIEIEEAPAIAQTSDILNETNKNVDAIVEEVIARLIDRKIYDDKTKPEDIKPNDRQIIQQIVEEVLSEKMNFSTAHEM